MRLSEPIELLLKALHASAKSILLPGCDSLRPSPTTEKVQGRVRFSRRPGSFFNSSATGICDASV